MGADCETVRERGRQKGIGCKDGGLSLDSIRKPFSQGLKTLSVVLDKSYLIICVFRVFEPLGDVNMYPTRFIGQVQSKYIWKLCGVHPTSRHG